jgi:hypothetical protein
MNGVTCIFKKVETKVRANIMNANYCTDVNAVLSTWLMIALLLDGTVGAKVVDIIIHGWTTIIVSLCWSANGWCCHMELVAAFICAPGLKYL